MNKIYGVIVGLVIDIDDPAGMGRVKLSYPSLGDEVESSWARVATLMAGDDRGSWFMPVVGDEALVAFEMGNMESPYILGYLWNGKDRPPQDDKKIRLLRSVNGHEIEIGDPDISSGDKGYLRLKDAHGNTIELTNGQIKIRGVANITIEAPTVVINGRVVVPIPTPI